MLKHSINYSLKSRELYERAQQVMPGGCSRNTILRHPHPVYAAFAKGCIVTDIEGIERIDFANNVASLIHGHANPVIMEAVTKQLQMGSAFAVGTEVEVEFAEFLVDRCDSFEQIRFVNSGTEAVMACIKAARAFTGKPAIAKVEGSYHGLYDYAEVSQTAKPENWGNIDRPESVAVSHGTPDGALKDVIVIPFNDPEKAGAILDENKDRIAGVLIDPLPHRIGVIPASSDFIDTIRNWTNRNDALLIFDEVITFRTNYGGAQETYASKPDLTALGKMIGGGFPVGALAGRRDVMAVMNPLQGAPLFPHSGTFSANPVTMTAGLMAMKLFDRNAVERLNDISDYARTLISQAINASGVSACVTGEGSMFRIHFKEQAPSCYRTAFLTQTERSALTAFLNHVFLHGLLMVETGAGFLSTAMTKSDIDRMAMIMQGGFIKAKELTA